MNHNQNDGLLKMIKRTDPMIFADYPLTGFDCGDKERSTHLL